MKGIVASAAPTLPTPSHDSSSSASKFLLDICAGNDPHLSTHIHILISFLQTSFHLLPLHPITCSLFSVYPMSGVP